MYSISIILNWRMSRTLVRIVEENKISSSEGEIYFEFEWEIDYARWD